MSVTPLPARGLDALRERHRARSQAIADEVTVTAVDQDTGNEILGSIMPRIFTPPLITGPPGPCGCGCALTPDTSYGFDLVDFADQIGWPFEPWQRWNAIHMGELLADGRPRFRMVLVLVARQNGKTIMCRILTLYWMTIQRAPLVIGTSTGRDTAKESWQDVIDFALENLLEEFGSERLAVRKTLSEEHFQTLGCTRHCRQDHEHKTRSIFKFAALGRRAGRSKTVHRIIMDELREQDTFDTYNALVKAMTAVPDGQAVAITNQGDATSVVLDSLRNSALSFIETGEGDPRLFLSEYSAPSGSDPTDPHAIAAANPDLNRSGRIRLDSIMGDAIRAKNGTAEELTGYKTETLCMRVPLLDPAIDPDSWTARGVPREEFPDLAQHRRAVALVIDVSLDATHATLYAAAKIDGTVYGDVVKAWQGEDCTKQVREELADVVAKIRPKLVGWLPDGPAAVIAADLRRRRGGRSWAPRGTKIEELRGDIPAVCMGFADLVSTGGFAHARDPLVNKHVDRTQKLTRGDVWVFTRAGSEPVDATYAAAGAVHLARLIPRPRGALSAVPDAEGALDRGGETEDPGF